MKKPLHPQSRGVTGAPRRRPVANNETESEIKIYIRKQYR